MKLLFDFFPILLFFIAYKLVDIYAATLVAIAAAFLQVAYTWFKARKVENMHLISLVLIVVFGGATLFLKDETFIKWKPTVLNWLFGLAFLGSHWFGKKTLIERMLGGQLELPAAAWKRLSLSWVLFFFVIGGVNLFVAYRFDTDTWVNFKLFGMLGLTMGFVVLQSFLISRYLPEPEPKPEE
jgi:intracellular septation protein